MEDIADAMKRPRFKHRLVMVPKPGFEPGHP